MAKTRNMTRMRIYVNDFEGAMQDLDQDSRDGAEQGGEEEEN
jgi:hypothetical protein